MILLRVLTMFFVFISGVSLCFGEDQGAQKFQGFNLQGYDDSGNKSWDVNGDTADVNGSKINISKVVANAYGQEKVKVTADHGEIDQESGKMALSKDVVITSQKGTRLQTESLNWDRNKDLVSTKDNVLITDKGMTLQGKGMDAKPNLQQAQIHEDVAVKVDTHERNTVHSKYVTITSDGPMEIDQAKSMAVFQDNVIAVQEDRVLKSDRIEIFFDRAKNTVKEMVCTGNVIIIQGENKTYADKATYRSEDQKIILSGRPKLMMVTDGKDGFKSLGN